MKATLVREFGGPGVVELEEVPRAASCGRAGPASDHVDGGRTAVWLYPRTNSPVTLRKLKGINSER